MDAESVASTVHSALEVAIAADAAATPAKERFLGRSCVSSFESTFVEKTGKVDTFNLQEIPARKQETPVIPVSFSCKILFL